MKMNRSHKSLSCEEAAALAKLSCEELESIELAILECALPRWRKVAMVVSLVMEKLGPRYPQFSVVFYAERVGALADQGRLESQGNLSYMRFSEVSLPQARPGCAES